MDVVVAVDAFGRGQRPRTLPHYFQEDVALAEDLFLGPMRDIRGDLVDACEPRGIRWEPPQRAYPAHYVLGRRDAPGHSWEFDPDGRLKRAVLLSRLVQPTSLAYGRAGRVCLDDAGALERFSPSPTRGGPAKAYVANPDRNWFDDEQVQRIADLIRAFDPDRLPERVLHALWTHEHTHQLYYVDVRWPLVTSGLEALVHTERHGSTRQFVQRLLVMQHDLALNLANEELLGTLYDRRSTVVHGQRVGDLDAETNQQYSVLEELLRSLLRCAILEPDFSGKFESPDHIRTAWPLA